MQDVGVQLEGAESRQTAAAWPEFAAFVDFMVTGEDASGEFRCADCGYGAVVHRALPPCPMCGGTIWESRVPR